MGEIMDIFCRTHPLACLSASEVLGDQLRNRSVVHVGAFAAPIVNHRRCGLLPLDAVFRRTGAQESG